MTGMFEPLTQEELAAAPMAAPQQDDWTPLLPPATAQQPPNFSGNGTLGSVAGVWEYRDGSGTLEGFVVRFNQANGEKTFRPCRYGRLNGQEGWRWRGWGDNRPLYGLPDILARSAAPLLIVEGEKCADAAARIFPDLVATTPMNGAQSPQKTDWGPVTGRAVTIWPDADQPGRDFAQRVAQLCGEAGAASVHIVALPETFPDKWDLGDPIPEGWDLPKLAVLLDTGVAAVAITTAEDPPLPLTRNLREADPFPVAALGDLLGSATSAIHDRIQAPVAICAQSVLAAASLCVQGHADVVLPTGHAKPLSGFFISIAETGARKSAVDTEALWPIRKREKDLRDAYDTDHVSWQNDQEAWEKQRSQVVADKKKYPDRKSKREALDDLGPPPTEPPLPILTCPEPTYEGLCKLFARGHPSQGVFSAEGGQFVGGHGMTEDHKLRTAAGLSSLWDGEPIRRVRAGEGAFVLPGLRLSMHLMVQPDIATSLLSDRVLADQGMLSRLLVTAPPSAAGQRLWREPRPESDVAIKKYGARLLSILERAAPTTEGKQNELSPRTLPLSSRARQLWIAFVDHVERAIAPDGEMETIKGLANKLPELAARIAGVLALVDDIDCVEVSAEDMTSGINLAEHYALEAIRLFDAGHVDPDLQLAQRVLDWLHSSSWESEFVSVPDLYTYGPNPVRDKKTASRIVRVLEDHRWLHLVADGAVIGGTKRREAWRIRVA